MNSQEQYAPGRAAGAKVRKDGEKWTLVLVRDLRHSPDIVAGDALKFGGWQRLNTEYAAPFGIVAPTFPPPSQRSAP